jgi:iron complex transport system permease protein
LRAKPNDQTSKPDYKLRFAILTAVFVACFLSSFLLGRYPVSLGDLIKVLLSRVFPVEQTWPDAVQNVILNVRLPRIMAAVLIGMALSAAGAAYQGIFRNPMVSPDILGASSGAGFGAALAIFIGLGYAAISTFAFIAGLLAVILAYVLSRLSRSNAVIGMVLAGIMIGNLFMSGTSYIKLVADTDSQLPAITYWLMGSLAGIRNSDLIFAAVPVIAGLLPLFLLRWRINILTVGDEEAKSLGINTGLLRGIIVAFATLATAASVSISGMIGWVGLVIPHVTRMIFGFDYRRIMPASMLLGACYLLVVDDIARIFTTSEIPLGILTSFVGAPVFIYLLLSGGKRK